MTAIMIIVAALFGGLCWAGRRPRPMYYDPDLADHDVEPYCDCDGGDYSSDRD
jgi:hypothetical protein